MSAIGDSLDKAIVKFAGKSGSSVTPEMIANLRACIESSPELTDKLNLAFEQGSVKSFAPLPDNGMAAGGVFEPKNNAIMLHLRDLDEKYSIQDMAFTLGHEVQHSFNAAERAKSVQLIITDIARVAKDRNDDSYDAVATAWQQAGRLDESKAAMAGWNAAVSQLRQEFDREGKNKPITLEDMKDSYGSRSEDFIEHTLDASGRINGYRLRDGVTLKDDMSVDMSDQGNVAALGKYYYDDPRKTVGHAHSTYANYNGAPLLSTIIDAERKYGSQHMTIDLASHGMSEDKLEINGINLGRNIRERQPYIDTSHGQERLGHFDHTSDSRVSPKQLHQYVPIAPAVVQPDQSPGFDDPQHPEHALYNEIKQRLPPETSPDRLTQITLAASRGGVQSGEVSRIDVQDTKLYLQGAVPGDKAVVDLTSPPPGRQDSMRQFETIEQQRTQQMQEMDRQTPQQASPHSAR